MTRKGKLATCALFIFALSSLLPLAGGGTAGAYPPAGTGFTGWTAESMVGLFWPHHVQMASNGSSLYMVVDNGNDVHLYRADNKDALAWGYVGEMWIDNADLSARDAYLDAEGSYVACSWKEWNGSSWGLCVALSSDCGASWMKWRDSSPGWNNYEAHVDICDGKLHCAYVSDYVAECGRVNEVYYLRFNLGLGLECCAPVSDRADGVQDTTPCLEASSAYNLSVYYSHDIAGNNPIWQSWTGDGGANWGRGSLIAPDQDCWWPECVRLGYQVIVICQAREPFSGVYNACYERWNGSSWDLDDRFAAYSGPYPIYPQIAARGDSALLVTYRDTTSGRGRGSGQINTAAGDPYAWSYINDLFYNNLPYDNPGSIDCCSDGARFYAAQAGTGDHAEVMTKREDAAPPTAYINNPGKYQRGDFLLSAPAWDDYNRDGSWMLGPYPCEAYQGGIIYEEYRYRLNDGGWADFPGGAWRGDSPWERVFAPPADGVYDFWVRAFDTSLKYTDAYLDDIIVDRTPPAVDLQVSGPDGTGGWYINQPSLGPQLAAQDGLSGVKASYFKFDNQPGWTVYGKPFALIKGEHVIYYYAEDNAGNACGIKDFAYKADFTDPRGTITSPANLSYVTTSLSPAADASDDLSGIARVEFYCDGSPLGACSTPPYAGSADIRSLADGQKEIKARVIDKAGRWAWTDQVLVKKDTTPPTVEITEPTGEQWMRGMVTIKADIRDNMEVGRAAFYVDGELIDERTSAPWMAAWDTSAVVNGYHALRVEAWDAAGNQAGVSSAGEAKVYVGNNISETNNFAEGCTRPGFDTWLCLQNPGAETANVTVNYYLGEGQGAASARTYALPAHSRTTVYVNGDVGTGKDVSIQVTSSKPIVSERPMYFHYQGTAALDWKGGHTAQGAHLPRGEWYFAEGCTRPGFETWLCLQNPEGREAEVRVEYMMEGGAHLYRTYRVAPWSRGTILVNREVGEGHDVSMLVASESPIVAERPMYFLYQGMWDGGHNVMGAAQPERDWYFAEGCTRTGFNQWLCLANPNAEATTARITYVMEDGGRIEREYGLEPHSRFTVNVNNDVARQHDVSAHILSELPIVAERPMYFLYNSSIDEGSNAMGVCKPGSSWYLAEGCTRAGFEEWICLMNPGEEKAQVVLRFMLEDTSQIERMVTVPPGTRVTVKVNDVVGPERDVSTEVMSDHPVIVERPMYSVYRGSCPSGDTLSGYTFNP